MAIKKLSRWNVRLTLVVGLLLFNAVAFFYLGKINGERSCNINSLNEVHYEPEPTGGTYEPSFQTILAQELKHKLKAIAQPYTKEKINSVIHEVEEQTNLRNFMTLVTVDSSLYKVIISNGDNKAKRSSFLLLANDSIYYLKPLKIVKDLK
ncbi:hypothetical protein [Mucilaginibacter agri]|uniref:Uncharacterized protein n=1 Tax=Mucilaginibacter agri TaxID=2695265 RepID=A0A965ZE91_9SPHI|nr:hypothetical protein [Mucilaginibacter agri]NCD68161.1 hypothetical protein [Mucilaginibacter agri]